MEFIMSLGIFLTLIFGTAMVFSQDFEDVQPLLVDTLNNLRDSVINLRKEESELAAEKDYLKRLLQQCKCDEPAPLRGCSQHPPPCYVGVLCIDLAAGNYQCGPCPPGFRGNGVHCVPERKHCDSSPCFRGVQCYEITDGYRCGPCPRGYEGDGERCTQESACRNNPCFPGVQCYDLEGGRHRCGPCPRGYEGDGERCTPVSACRNNPCFLGVQCYDLDGGRYRCGPCPRGYEGDGERCTPSSACKNNPCFPGVQCYDLDGGRYRCGPCPRGYSGDGERCTAVRHCDSNPCYYGVQCYESHNTFSCGPCPENYEGDGQRCTPKPRYCDSRPCYPGGQCYEKSNGYECVCHSGYENFEGRCRQIRICESTTVTCAPGVICTNTEVPPYFSCGDCPPGYTGNGVICTDVNECEVVQPCDIRVTCTNLIPGFRCDPCPPGYKQRTPGGSGVSGVGVEYARRHRQECIDIDECEINNGGCLRDTQRCINTEGSYHCEECIWTEVSPARPWPFNFTRSH